MRCALAVVMLVSLSVAAAAVDHPEEARKLSLKDARGRQSLSWVASTPPPPAPVMSPLDAGATLVVRTAGGESASFDLPASGWTTNAAGTTFKFRNSLAPGGPSAVRSATIKSQRVVKVRGKGVGITLDEPAQGTVTVELTVGADVYCSTCTAPRHDEPGHYVAARCPAPTSCPTSTTTTTTSTSTTTSTFVPGVCGNGVVDPGEECDGTDPGICDDFTPPFPIGCNPPMSSGTACTCCGINDCVFGIFGNISCCGDAQCQDTTGVGQQRGGVCIPPSCAQDADCNGYQCVGGTCCGDLGTFCGAVGCCPGTGATCSGVPWAGAPVCCRPAGATCSAFSDCCSGSCAPPPTLVCD